MFERESAEAVSASIAAISDMFRRPLDVEGEEVVVKLAFGIGVAPVGDVDEIRLVEAAESALARVTEHKRIALVDLSRNDTAFDRLGLMRDLPGAIAGEQMFVVYQPKVHIRRQEVCSAEALIRWQHPVLGLISPGDFISIAEEAGEIAALTLWTLHRVIADQRRLVAAGHDFPIFINISGILLSDQDFVDEAIAVIRDSGARIGFEITETSVIGDPEGAIGHLHAFADIGVLLAIDDYGAGLSSLAYLKQLPASELKIDKMFVLQLTSSHRDPLIVRSTIDLAHALEMEVTAEGVETPSALALLSVMGCDMAQGFLISQPVRIDAFQRFLEEDGHLKAGAGAAPPFLRRDAMWKRA